MKPSSGSQRLAAALNPQLDVKASVRKLPQPKAAELHTFKGTPIVAADAAPPTQATGGDLRHIEPPAQPAILKPLTPERYKIQVTVSREAYEKLRRAQDLLRHTIPNGDPAAIVERALTLFVAELEKKKAAVTQKLRASRAAAAGSRHIPDAVRREVWQRDGGQCAFVGADGRCRETGFLEFHHVVPFADGGQPTGGNIQLRCRAHNAYEADRWFGPMFVRDRSSVWAEWVTPCYTLPRKRPAEVLHRVLDDQYPFLDAVHIRHLPGILSFHRHE